MSERKLGAALGLAGSLVVGLALVGRGPGPREPVALVVAASSELLPEPAASAGAPSIVPAPCRVQLPGDESGALRRVRLVGDDVVGGEDEALRRLLAQEAVQRGDGRGRALADWMVGLDLPEIPVKPDERVEQYVRYFTETEAGRSLLNVWLKRSGQYRGTVRGILAERGLPLDLDAVVFVESGFSPHAVSEKDAVGLWQLMAETARAYGVRVARDYDERRSIRKATEASVRFLGDLYARFGSWDLALAAYNLGYGRLVGRMRDVTTYDFWVLARNGVLPMETALYVPKVMAMAIVLKNLARYDFLDVRPLTPLQTSDVPVPPRTPLALVARACGTTVQRLRELNPEVLFDRAPEGPEETNIHVPGEGLSRARTMLPKLLAEAREAERRAVEPRAVEPRAAEPRVAEPRVAELRAPHVPGRGAGVALASRRRLRLPAVSAGTVDRPGPRRALLDEGAGTKPRR